MATARSTTRQPKKDRVPSYRVRSGYSHAIVTLTDSATGKRRDYWLGPHGSPESKEAYYRLLAEWEACGRRLPDERLSAWRKPLEESGTTPPPLPSPGQSGARTPDLVSADHEKGTGVLTVNDVIYEYWRFAKGYYRGSSLYSIRIALRVVRELYGTSRAAAFGPNALRVVREAMVHGSTNPDQPRGAWARKTVNTRVGDIQRMFRWAASRELVDAGQYQALQTLPPLKRGRSKAADYEPVRPVAREAVEAIKPFVSRQVAALIDLQLLTGARPGELLQLRPCDVDTGAADGVWSYQPKQHKNVHRGKDRAIHFGPKAQAILRGFMLDRPLDAFMFSPIDAEIERRAKLSERRRTPLSCGNKPGTGVRENPEVLPGETYSTASYRRAIERGCDLAFPAPSPLCRREIEPGRFEGEGAFLSRLTPKQRMELERWRKANRWHPHQLRHLAATEIRRQFGLEASALMLGHASATLTDQVYAERDEGKVRIVAAKIG